jgi:hypothetical protein
MQQVTGQRLVLKVALWFLSVLMAAWLAALPMLLLLPVRLREPAAACQVWGLQQQGNQGTLPASPLVPPASLRRATCPDWAAAAAAAAMLQLFQVSLCHSLSHRLQIQQQ